MVGWGYKIEKPICFVGHGFSLKDFDERIEEFRNVDVCWISLNLWEIAGDILKKIDKDIDYHIWYQGANGHVHPKAIRMIKSEARGCSLLEFIYQCCENGVKELYLFGCDGFTPNGNKVHYYGKKADENAGWMRHSMDTKHFNTTLPRDLIRESGLQIYNTSLDSHYDIPKITIDQCLKKLTQEVSSSLTLQTA